jgi:hypothetical protein
MDDCYFLFKGVGQIKDIIMRNNIYTPINLHTHKFVLCSIALDCSPQLYARVDILPARRKHFHDCIISLKGESRRWRNG